MKVTFETLMARYRNQATAAGIDVKSPEFVRFLLQCVAAYNRQ